MRPEGDPGRTQNQITKRTQSDPLFSTKAQIVPKVGIPLTQPDVASEVVSCGRPRPCGGPCLRVRQRDGGVRAVQGNAPPSRSQRQRLSERDTQLSRFSIASNSFTSANRRPAGIRMLPL